MKEYYLKNKNKLRSKNNDRAKKYYHENKERISKEKKEYYLNNKEYFSVKSKKRRDNLRGFHYVYILPIENYVGVTEFLNDRIVKHKSLGRCVDDFMVLKRCESRSDALELEEFLHELGYSGKHSKNVYK